MTVIDRDLSVKADQYALRKGSEESGSDGIVRVISLSVFSLSVAFFSVVSTISYIDPDFFERMLIADIEGVSIDPLMVGSTSKASKSIEVEPMPAQRVVRRHELQPQDFAIVMVFGEEAHLASPGELWRIRPGMIVPGLGKVLSIEETEDGGTIKTENAVLTGIPQ
ncbi:hypothetical protein FP2506_18664 [Fulvimarina pelagi HTCC2506]|uniref:Uncharacterized protein n=1 Tax=Fulvimarina pelagi HTCC2506 TaxID=314231 RepID=Q0G0Q0_9HYPH|nr:hypothetical protein [Fulvimarina pelagi]EAU40939.1 hypothetical protein FP2506_18664 [Fulvimarina pelagi HTCC2506]